MSNTINNSDIKKIGIIIGGIGIVIIVIFFALICRRENFKSSSSSSSSTSLTKSNNYLMNLRMKKCYSFNDIDAILNLVPGTYEMIENGKVQPDSETKERLRKLLTKCENVLDGPSGMPEMPGMNMIRGFTGGMNMNLNRGFTGPIQRIQKEFYSSSTPSPTLVTDDVTYKGSPFIDKDIIVSSASLQFIKSGKQNKFKLVLAINKNNKNSSVEYLSYYETTDGSMNLYNNELASIGVFRSQTGGGYQFVFNQKNNTGLPDDIWRVIQKISFQKVPNALK